MEKRVPFDIGAHFETFIKIEISEGRYRNPSDVVRAALRLLEEHEAQLAAWRLALEDGDTSGFATPFDFDAFIAKKQKLAKKKRAEKLLRNRDRPICYKLVMARECGPPR